MRRLRKFWRDQRGNTAIIFGLAIIPLLALGGGAVDFAHRHKVRGELQSAADTAALAAARIVQVGQMDREDWEDVKEEAERAARRLLHAAFAQLRIAGTPSVTIDISEESLNVRANYDVDTAFLGIIGIDKLKAGAFAEVNLPDPILVEIALVLDYSGSMRDNNKYVRMTAAAREFIAKVDRERGERTKIGIVPFSEYVLARMRGGFIRGTSAGDANDSMTECLLNRDYPVFSYGGGALSCYPREPLAQGLVLGLRRL